jgi:hypothetical protein
MTLPIAPTSSVPRRLEWSGFFAILILVALSSTLSVAGEEQPADSVSRAAQGDSALTYPTNAQFVRRGVGIATRRVFEGFPFVRPKPLWITTAEGQKTNFWFEETASRALFDRGFVVQESPGEDTANSSLWAVRYRFDRFSLSLPRTARHSFLGSIWAERVFDLSLQLQVWDMESGQLLWSNSVDSTWTDWVPKRRLKDLSEATSTFLSPAPPTTGLERFAEPAMIIAAAGALTALFFVVR